MRSLAALLFAAILMPLGIRLVLPFVARELPSFVDPFVSLMVGYTDLLAAPFRAFAMPGLADGAGLGFDRIESHVVIALIGWSILQAVVLTALGLVGRRPTPSIDRA